MGKWLSLWIPKDGFSGGECVKKSIRKSAMGFVENKMKKTELRENATVTLFPVLTLMSLTTSAILKVPFMKGALA